MTLTQAITMTLNRVGLNPTTTAYKDQARLYLNMTAKRISGEIGGKWWWLHKSTTFTTTKTMTVSGITGTFTAGETVTADTSGIMTVTGISGTFTQGETVTGGTSGETGTITTAYAGSTAIPLSAVTGTFTASETITGGTSGATATFSSFAASSFVVDANYDATNYPTALLAHTISSTFTTSDTLTGGSSSAFGTYVSIAVTQTYALSADVLVPHSFVDVTNDRTIVASGWDNIDQDDPDRDYETDARVWSPEGVDALSGKIRVRLFPYHDTPGDTIRYRYRGFIVDWTSGDDSTELDRYLPEIFQPALPFGAAEMYLQEKGDSEAAGENRFEYNGVIDRGKETNRTIWGNRTWRRNRGDDNNQFVLADGSLTAAS